ncbi:Autophagy-related protein 22 [Fulvia fulva]|uniref:Autophagy-related protein n=1 Tax=Passalora fulva TaxID=5499 RepID=A0A9Q8PHR8_PASFU|nr:Autophagy-related protein 22 [Fulvia fulva]KAK4615509.1 Autophagy-related protein 22 [Fulvia fulva]KAK4617053.1 Autophagy-related protein 22 [Fulvia fulva]UJO22642.1 Autophagy-related protein 22 [Fulvia fulva]WPV18863.1 Autophagy-related protein 22 [Fulvia fulva]WPV33686.1 Autophagy-related protein 22 [Fulvia fulva]
MAEAEHSFRAPRYDNEDVSPTSERELRGWYSTGLAAEIYAVCGVGSFAPVTLEQFAREAGVLRSDGVSSCIKPKAGNAARRLAETVARAAESSNDDLSNQCVIWPFGRPIATQSFAMYTFSMAVFVQALVLISFSPVADYGTYRKRLMMGFAFTGAFLTMSMVFVWPKVYLLGSLFTIIGVVCLGSTFVLLNSFLPLLAANHPTVSHAQTKSQAACGQADKTSPELKLSTQISSKGVGLGYAAAVSVQILCIILLVLLKKANFASESTPLRCVLLLVGVCWSLLTLPGSLWLRDRPGPSLRVVQPWKSKLPAVVQYLVFAWGSVWKTVKTAAKLRQVWVFLIAWFLLSDAIATVSGTAIMFARTELEMSTTAIALLSITATLSGIAGAFTWPHILRRLKLQTKHTIIGCMIIMEIIPLYGLLGFVPFIKSWGVLGLQQAWEIYPLGFVHGFVMGGLSSYCRSFYGEIIPPGSEAAFYALYAITDKGSSAVGPAIVGAMVDAVGTIRPAFGFLAILIALPMPLVYLVDVQKGRAEAVAMSKHIAHATGGITMQDYDDERETDAGEGLLRQQPDDEDEAQR